MRDLQSGPGVYTLILAPDRPCWIRVGRLGTLHFPAGYYLYIGSARRGIRSRAARYLRPPRLGRWQVDHLLWHAKPAGIYQWAGDRTGECRIAAWRRQDRPQCG